MPDLIEACIECKSPVEDFGITGSSIWYCSECGNYLVPGQVVTRYV